MGVTPGISTKIKISPEPVFSQINDISSACSADIRELKVF